MRVAEVLLLSRETTRLMFDRMCLMNPTSIMRSFLREKWDALANVFEDCSQIQGCGGDQRCWGWYQMTSFAHPCTESGFGNAILVGVV